MTIARHGCFDVYWTLGRHDSKAPFTRTKPGYFKLD